VIEPTGEMERAFEAAWEAVAEAEGVINCSEHDMGDCPYHEVPGARRRAGLAAVLAIVERDHVIDVSAFHLAAQSRDLWRQRALDAGWMP